MLLRIRKNRPSFSLFNIFQQTRHRNYPLSTFAPQNDDSKHSSKRPHVGKSPPHDRREFDDIVSSHRMITSYVRNGDLSSALNVFDGMKIKTTVTWNSILAGYCKKPGKMKEAHQLFEKIPHPDNFSYNMMLVCHLNNLGAESAMEFFDTIPVKDTVTWNTMISGFSRDKKMERARELFDAMPVEKNGVSWSAMISGYAGSGDMESAAELFGSAPAAKTVVAWTAMIDGYMRLGEVESAETLFDRMAERNSVTWNAMIAGYVGNCRAEKGLKIFREMLVSGVKPSPSSLSSVLLGCSELSALQTGKQVHGLVSKSPTCNDTASLTSMLSMYCKCGALDDARRLFLEIRRKDTVAWNAMIAGLAKHGAGREALELFQKMTRVGPNPDSKTFVAVLSACNHSGLVDLGLRYFDSMERDHGIEPKPEHYACTVDLLGRAGRVSEAAEMIRKMPFEPCDAVFGALLRGCRRDEDVGLAEYAAESLLRRDPSNACAYVELANVYASAQRWDRVSKVLRSMRRSKAVKEPGWSWIEVKSEVHEFVSGHRNHPEIASIHEKLAQLDQKMKELDHYQL